MKPILSLTALLALTAAVCAAEQSDPPPTPTDDQAKSAQARDDDQADDDGDGRRGRRRGGQWQPTPLSPEEVEIAVEIVELLNPDSPIAQRIRKQYDEDPEQVSDRIQSAFPRIRFFIQMRRQDPDLFELRVQDLRLSAETSRVARLYHEAAEVEEPSEERTAALQEELQAVVEEHFEVRQQIREHELGRLEARLMRLRDELDARSEIRESLIADRVEELTSEDYTESDGPPHPPGDAHPDDSDDHPGSDGPPKPKEDQ